MPESINTGGGAIFEQNVEAGTLIGRDQIIMISGYTAEQLDVVLPRLRELFSDPRTELRANTAKARLTVTSPGAPSVTLSEQAATDLLPAATRQADERAYLAALVVNPRYGRWASQFVPLAGTMTVREAPPGWADVPPEFTELEISGEGAQRQIRRIRLDDITQAIERHPALALLGEPGAGKTTTLYRLLLDAARCRLTKSEGPLPILLPLADYRDYYPSPHAFLEEKWRQWIGTPDMARRLRQGELFLLCDALNEMPFRDAGDYRKRVKAWRRFVQEWPGNRMVLTCRSRDYSEPLGLPQVEIERLDNDRVQDFLRRYLTEELAARAWKRLDGNPLLELVRNPYYLNMLTFLLAKGGCWPASRAGLFEGFVSTLLARERKRGHPDWPGEAPLKQALAVLAETMQALGEGTRLPRKEVLARLPQQIEGPDGPVATPPSTVLRLGLAATLLDTELATAGEEEVRFYHHQLQEYFAARALLERFRVGEDLSLRWRQPRLIAEMPDPGPLGDDEPLPPPPTTGWEEPTLLAASLAPAPLVFVEAARRVNPVLAARCLIEAGIKEEPARAVVQEDLLGIMGQPDNHLRARLVAGEVLGSLSDPRFEVIHVNGRRVLLPSLVAIPGGPFRMGSSRWEVWKLSRRGFRVQDERPRHGVDVPAFSIGKYLVTNAEFDCFIEAGGYQEERWWETVQARAWRRGEWESGWVEDWMDRWRALKADPSLIRRQGWSPKAVADWEQLVTLDEEEFYELASQSYNERSRDRPAFRDDERFKNPSQPVVGVTWFEAQAYCRWLNEQWRAAGPECGQPLLEGYRVRLPTEAEWEKAARSPGDRRYPWGKHWDPDRANTFEGHVLRTTPVGIYPAGVSAAGVHDLSGNVWEWTLSLYRDYPYDPGDGRNDPEAGEHRVVRGGSWFDVLRVARQVSSRRPLRRLGVSGGGVPGEF